MKSSRTRRSKKASPDDARKPAGVAHARRHRRGVTAGASANSPVERERALVAREEAVARRERVLRLEEAIFRASQPPTQTRADIERLIGHIPKQQMIRLLHEKPEFADRFIAHMLARNIRIEEDVVDQLFNSSDKRLARALLLLAHYGKPGKAHRALPPINPVASEGDGSLRPTTFGTR